MLLLALLLPPLAFYLIVLGWINRRPRPVMTAGTWDFVGVLFALSGFLLVGGPAFLGSLDEQSRLFWLLGETAPARASAAGQWSFWLAARLLYFTAVAGGAAFMLWRSRRLTSLYNVDSPTVFTALEQAFQRLGITLLRSGDAFLIGGRTVESAPKERNGDGIRAAAEPQSGLPATLTADPIVAALVGASTALHVDAFPLMRHVTLRWDPADAPVRREVERELARALAEATGPEQEPIIGGCLSVLGVSLFFLTLLAGGVLLMLRLFPR